MPVCGLYSSRGDTPPLPLLGRDGVVGLCPMLWLVCSRCRCGDAVTAARAIARAAVALPGAPPGLSPDPGRLLGPSEGAPATSERLDASGPPGSDPSASTPLPGPRGVAVSEPAVLRAGEPRAAASSGVVGKALSSGRGGRTLIHSSSTPRLLLAAVPFTSATVGASSSPTACRTDIPRYVSCYHQISITEQVRFCAGACPQQATEQPVGRGTSAPPGTAPAPRAGRPTASGPYPARRTRAG